MCIYTDGWNSMGVCAKIVFSDSKIMRLYKEDVRMQIIDVLTNMYLN